jgi:hypothetical protein
MRSDAADTPAANRESNGIAARDGRLIHRRRRQQDMAVRDSAVLPRAAVLTLQSEGGCG